MAKNLTKRVETSSATWKRAKFEGVQYVALNTDFDEQCGTFLFRLEPGAHYPRHRHLGEEEIFVLKGELEVANVHLNAGDFLFSPPNSSHELSTVNGCVFLATCPKPLQIVTQGSHDEMEDNSDAAAPDVPAENTDVHDPSLRDIPPEKSET